MRNLFSIIVPVYNQEAYLIECLNSICEQTFLDFELIVVDDGSTDHSPELMDAYQKSHAALAIKIIHKENGGLLHARYAGMQEAGGDYILHVDSDDYLEAGALEKIAAAIKKHNQPDAIFFNAHSGDGVNFFSVDFQEDCLLDRNQVLDAILTTNSYNSIWSKCYKRNLYDMDVIYEDAKSITMAEDIYQVIPLTVYAKSYVYIDKALYYYRTNNQSMTHSWKPQYYDSVRKVMERRLLFAETYAKEHAESTKAAVSHNLMFCVTTARDSSMPRKEKTAELKRIIRDPFYVRYAAIARSKQSGKRRIYMNLLHLFPGLMVWVYGIYKH